MIRHSEAVSHLIALHRYCINIENCDDCAIQEHCHLTMLTEADKKKLRARAEELEVQERVKEYKNLEETKNVCRKCADEIRKLVEK